MVLGAVDAQAIPEKNLFVPKPTRQSQPFWDGCRAHRLTLQRCTDCRQFRHYPRPRCPRCLSKSVEWSDVSGNGHIYTFTVIHRPPLQEMISPYVVAQIALVEGVRMMSQVVDVQPDAVHIDMPVSVSFVDTDFGISIPVFRPGHHSDEG